MSSLFNIWHSIQHTLFPWLENELDPLTEKQQEFIRVIELAEVQKHMSPYRWQGIYLFKKTFAGYGLLLIDMGKGSSTAYWAIAGQQPGSNCGMPSRI